MQQYFEEPFQTTPFPKGPPMERIHTQRLFLRPLVPGDLEDFYEYASHPQVGPDTGWKPLESIEEAEAKLREFIAAGHTWAVEMRASGKMIGTIALYPDKFRNHDGAKEIGYSLNSDCRNRGYMTEAARGVVRHAFSLAGVSVLSAVHYPFNAASRRILEKCGFAYEGTMRRAYMLYTGEIHD